jgi:tRNA (cytosine40_48-C5)-methyltransferase
MSGREWFINRYRNMGSNLNGDESTFQSIRVNPLKITGEELTETLIEQGVALEKVPLLDHGFKIIDSPFSLGASIEYLLGLFSLQEAASQYPVQALNPKPTDTVLDMASAPGGKTTQLASYMKNSGLIVAIDVNRDRLYATENNVERCGVINTSIHNLNALDFPEKPVFSKILLDAPCSGNFITDPNWFNRRTIDDIKRNSELQKALLSKAMSLLESKGKLMYSTCSLEPEENEFNIQWLLETHDVALEKLNGFGSPALTQINDISLDKDISRCRRFWPDVSGTQGFFLALVVKN